MNKILFLGDFFYDIEGEKDDIKEIINTVDKNGYRTILNLEGTLVKTEIENLKKRGPRLSHSLNSVDILKKLNTIGVCMANNHTMDYNEKGLEETIQLLEKNNIKHCGAGEKIEQAIRPMIIANEKQKMYIYNYGWNIEETQYATKLKAGCAPRKEELIIRQIENKRQEDTKAIIIVELHWGFEYNLYPMPLDRKLAYKIMDAGADMIIGHHPHCIQPFEMYKNKPIYYSLGNFYFGDRRDDFGNKMFRTKFAKDRCNYGLGIVYDSKERKVDKEIIFYYDKEEKNTLICNEVVKKDVLEDISSITYNTKKYLNLVKEGNHNITPILTGNSIIDFFKIMQLQTYYFLKKVKKKLLRGRIVCKRM